MQNVPIIQKIIHVIYTDLIDATQFCFYSKEETEISLKE